MSTLKDFRCSKCNKLLGKIDGKAEIVCPRCKVLNAFGVPAEYVDIHEEWEQFKKFLESHNISAATIASLLHLNMKGESLDDHETTNHS